MDKSIEIQHQIKMQCDTLKTDLASMKNWEKEMREKEKNKSQIQVGRKDKENRVLKKKNNEKSIFYNFLSKKKISHQFGVS